MPAPKINSSFFSSYPLPRGRSRSHVVKRKLSAQPRERQGWLRCLLLLVVLSTGMPTGHAQFLEPDKIPAADSSPEAKAGVGSWIWDEKTFDGQECRLWRTVEIPAGASVSSAKLRLTADNFFTLIVDGQEIGSGADWHTLTEYDLTELFAPGVHVLGIKAFNCFDVAGVLMGLRVELADGRRMDMVSDTGWRVVPNTEADWTRRRELRPTWPAAKVVGRFGQAPWRENVYRAVFQAPRSYPQIIPFWEQRWFRIAEAVFCGFATLACLYLLARLLIQSQARHVVDRERSRIARDIHDDLTAWLARLVLLGERTQKELPVESPARGNVQEMCENSRSLLAALNQTIWVINSKRDTLQDMVAYVCRYAESFFQPTTIRCRFDIEDGMPALPCDVGVRRNLFLATKEALNNTLRHSGAGEVTLRIHRQAGELAIRIKDNGKGFAPDQADRQRNGLTNMKARAEDAGGSCQIVSSPGAGCSVEFRVPLSQLRRDSLWSLLWRKGNRSGNSGLSTAAQPPSQPGASDKSSSNEKHPNT